MSLAAFVRPWMGNAYRNIPTIHRSGILDFRYAGRLANNRWNVVGEPTLYLGADRGVAAAEFSRHLTVERSPSLVPDAIDRDIFVFEDVRIDRTVDLRSPEIAPALSLSNVPACFEDINLCRAVAHRVRTDLENVQGILVPSMAFPDDLNRWVMVLFLEHLPADPRAYIGNVTLDATIAVTIFPPP